uniref:Short-chain dehydrogenase/reductase 3 n=1 Tax=Anopheles dirus TaxID=7168 RepID=A0A182N1N6_9DIPT
MTTDVPYFTNAENGYVPAKLASRSSSGGQPLRLLRFVVTHVIPDTVKFLVQLVPLIVSGLIGLVLPAKRKSIHGHTALVTGGANGLGRALCLRLAQEGCHVAVVDIDMAGAQQTATDVRKLGVKAEAFLADIANFEAVERLRLDVETKLGPVDVLVNNAGLLAVLSLTEGKAADVERIINVNLLSHFWTIRAFMPGMITRHRGHIVGIASIAAYFPVGRFIPYTVTKYAVRALMESLNGELRMDGLQNTVQTTCVYPALIATRQQFMDMLDKLNFLKRFYVFTPEQVAEQVVRGVLVNKREVFVPNILALISKQFECLPAGLRYLLVSSTIRTFIGGMKERQRGYILGVSSILGYLPSPRTVSYVATKFAVRGMMQSLQCELAMDGFGETIFATTLVPTFIATRKELMDLLNDLSLDEKLTVLTPEAVADAAIEGMLRGCPTVYVTPFFIRISLHLFAVPVAGRNYSWENANTNGQDAKERMRLRSAVRTAANCTPRVAIRDQLRSGVCTDWFKRSRYQTAPSLRPTPDRRKNAGSANDSQGSVVQVKLRCSTMQSLHNIGQAPYQKALSGKPTSSPAQGTLLRTLGIIGTTVLDILTFFVLLIPIVVQSLVGLARKAPKKNISGWTALVTGGANGLGRDICLQLAQAGCHIAVVDLDEVNGAQTVTDIRKMGVKSQFFKADVSSFEAVSNLKREVSAQLGPIDILVNNAGVLPLMSLREGTPDDLKKVIDINLLSHVWTLRLFTDDMIQRKRGHIVAIASIASYLPIERMITYVASKYGVRGLMGAFASELYNEGVNDTVKTTTVYPCFIKTRLELMDALKKMGIKNRVPIMRSETVARAVVGGILYNKQHVYIPKVIGPFVGVFENLPPKVAHLIKRCFLKTNIPNVMKRGE